MPADQSRSDAVAKVAGVLADRAQTDAPLGALTTYRVGGKATLFFEIVSEEDLLLLRRAVADSAVPLLVLGKGSNLLVADNGFSGLVISMAGVFGEISVDGLSVSAGAAVSLPVLARRTATEGLTGLEWAVGIPGSAGGAVRMNAGGHGSEISKTLVECRVIDLLEDTDKVLKNTELDFGYRRSCLSAQSLVVSADFCLESGEAELCEDRVREIVRWRRENQPGGQNAGSVFKNPTGDSAARLIESVGLKGKSFGTARVSTKHANFIQSEDRGSANDVFALIRELQQEVQSSCGILLEPEVQLVGFELPSQTQFPQ